MKARKHLRSVGPRGCEFHDCSICKGLPQEIRGELERYSHLKIYSAGDIIQSEEEDADTVGVVIDGVLKLEKTLYDGRQQIVGLMLPTDLFGRVFAHTSNVSITAATDATVCGFSRSTFEALMKRSPELEHQVLLAVLDELDVAQDWMTVLGCQTVMERVAAFLLYLRRRSVFDGESSAERPGMESINIPISRKDMAAYLGTTIESISRSTQSLLRTGVLGMKGPQEFAILDLAALLKASGRDAHEFTNHQKTIGRA